MFLHRVVRQHIIIIILTLFTLIGGYFLGIPVLSAIYKTDLCNYKSELLILLIGGGLLAISGFVVILITLIRKQKYLSWGYAFIAVLAFVFSPIFVQKYQISDLRIYIRY